MGRLRVAWCGVVAVVLACSNSGGGSKHPGGSKDSGAAGNSSGGTGGSKDSGTAGDSSGGSGGSDAGSDATPPPGDGAVKDAAGGTNDGGTDAASDAGACDPSGKVLAAEAYNVVGGASSAVRVPGGMVMSGEYTTIGLTGTPMFGALAAPSVPATGPDGYVLKRADDGTEVWLARPRGASSESALAVASDAAGDVYALVVTGAASGSLTADPLTEPSAGPHASYIVKLSGATGQAQWISPMYETSVGTYCDGIAAGGSTVVVVCDVSGMQVVYDTGASTKGSTSGFDDRSLAVLAFDTATGYEKWVTVLGLAQSGSASISLDGGPAVDASGNVVVLGTFNGGSLEDAPSAPSHSIDPVGNGDSAFIATLMADGEVSGLTAFGDNTDALRARFDSQGDLLVVGRYSGALTLGGVVAPTSLGALLAVVPDVTTLTPSLLTTAPMNFAADATLDSCGRYSWIGASFAGTWQGVTFANGYTTLKTAADGTPVWASGLTENDSTGTSAVVAGPAGRTVVVGRVEGAKSIPGGPVIGAADGLHRPFVIEYGP